MKDVKELIVAIDASRNRSGGAIAHIKGILTSVDPREFGIAQIHLWSYRKLLDELPDQPWLVKHCPDALQKNILHQMLWQFFSLPKLIGEQGCNILLTTDAGSVCNFSPSVVMSRDMLSFEEGEIDRFRWSAAWVRLFLLRYIQVAGLKRASGALFLTNYAAKIIQQFTGNLKQVRIIPHGISEEFRKPAKAGSFDKSAKVNCVYVSNADLYKHQWNVVDAIDLLAKQGYENIHLTLIGAKSGNPHAIQKLSESISALGPDQKLITIADFLPHHEIPKHLGSADLFIFASSCENMPNTLIEAMAAGLPIACSDRGPMPEVLGSAGSYFDPESAPSIANAIKQLIDSEELRKEYVHQSKMLSDRYSWKRCAIETWTYLDDVAKQST